MSGKYKRIERKEKKKKQEKGKDALLVWDKKTSLNAFLIFLGILVIYFIATTDFKTLLVKNDTNWTYTIGKMIKSEPKTSISQSTKGYSEHIVGYNVIYTYTVDGIKYDKEVVLGGIKTSDFIAYSNNIYGKRVVQVYYKKDNPSESHINIDLNSEFYKDK